MGLLDSIFKKRPTPSIKGWFEMLSGYTPAFTTYQGSIYEMEITRAAIHAFAIHCSKLKPEMQGSAYKQLGQMLATKMNPWMDTTKFIYRVATILKVDNNAFIVPLTDDFGDRITGYFPIRPSRSELLEGSNGDLWLRYHFHNGKKAMIEWDRVGVINQYLFSSDFIGENNQALNPTMNLITTNNQGIIEGVKQSATIRFMAKLASTYKAEDIAQERKRFVKENLSAENNSGVMMFDNKYSDIQQIESKPFVVSEGQMRTIQNNVYNYFGVNEAILQNKFTDKEWAAFYEGAVEPFALQLSLVMSNMTFTNKELSHGNKILFTANRLQYADNRTKLQVVTQLFDRGMMNQNDAREIFNMSPIPGGDKYFIRGEYQGKDPRQEESEDANDEE